METINTLFAMAVLAAGAFARDMAKWPRARAKKSLALL